MTKDEAINELIRIRQVQNTGSEAHEALEMAIDALSQPSLPEGLEELNKKAREMANTPPDRITSEGLFAAFNYFFLAGKEFRHKQDQELMKLSEDLEEVAMRDSLEYVDSIPEGGTDKHPWNDHDVEKAYYDGMLAGAEWQKEKDNRDMLMSDNRHFNNVYELGKKDMKEEMMEKAVVAEVIAGKEGDKWFVTCVGDYESMLKVCKPGDKVKIIVIPEEK